MQPTVTLLKAQGLVKRGQFDTAIKLYQGILRLNPLNAQVNSLMGELLIHMGQNERAAEVLERAYKASPHEEEHWVRLLAAQHRSGNLKRCRELLVLGEGLLPKEQLEMFAHGISQPPANRIDALMALFQKKNYVTAEISARMFIEDFPKHPFGYVVLRDILKATGRETEAQELLGQEPVSA